MQEVVVLLSIVINFIIFFVLHCRQRGEDVSITYKEESTAALFRKLTWIAIKTQLSQCIPTGNNIIQYSQKRVSRYGANHTTFAAFLCLNYILPYFMWTSGEVYHYNMLTAIRFLGATMCLLLLFKNCWPTRTLKYWPTYWHVTVMYVLPFSTTLSFLIAGGTTEWLINIALAIMMLIAVVDWLSFIILTVLGAGLGVSYFHLFFSVLGGTAAWSPDLLTIHHLIYTCIFSISVGLLFFRRAKKKLDNRLETLALFGKVASAEIQNILALSKAYAGSIKNLNEQMHVDKVLPPEDNRELCMIKMDKKVYASLQETTDSLMRDSEQVTQTINRILATLRQTVDTGDFTILSMKTCLTDALTLYKRNTHPKSNLLINLDEDFQFYGSAYYMQHVLCNLLDNAYKHSKKDCTVEIWLANHRLYVKDNGSGVAKEDLPYIFDHFFTTTKAAMGLGLTFCRLVMETLGGTIICKSKQGKHSFTEFVLTFPRHNKKRKKKYM